MRKISSLIKVFSFWLSLFLIGCIFPIHHQIQLTNFKTGQVLKGQYNIANHSITVTMPDGAVLKGKYSSVRDASSSFGTVTTQIRSHSSWSYSGHSTSSSGKGYALLKSATSPLMMEIIAVFSGYHGFGEARTNDGRIFKVQF